LGRELTRDSTTIMRMRRPSPYLALLFVALICAATGMALTADRPLLSDPECSLTDPNACNAKQGCVWCKSAAVGNHCYDEEEAKSLPASIFDCGFGELWHLRATGLA